MKKLMGGAFLAVALMVAGRLVAEEKGKAKYDIETIMEKAHQGGKDSLRNKVLAGKASKKELKQLVELYIELGKNTPPKGTKSAWKKKTDALIAAVKKVESKPEDEAALKVLGKATKCAACHADHKKD